MVGNPENPDQSKKVFGFPALERQARNLIQLSNDAQMFVDTYEEEIAQFEREADASGDEKVKEDAKQHRSALEYLKDTIIGAREVTEELPGLSAPGKESERSEFLNVVTTTYQALEEALRHARELIAPDGDIDIRPEDV